MLKRVVNRDPTLHPVPKLAKAELCVSTKGFYHTVVHPVERMFLEKFLWEVPMIEDDNGFDIVLQQGVDEVVIILHACLVNSVRGSIRKNSRPTQGKLVARSLCVIK